MGTNHYRFQLGSFECVAVNDGTFTYQHADKLLFINAPEVQLKPLLSKYDLGEDYVSCYPSLVINTGRHRVLVDTGAGKLAPTTGRLIENLQSAGLSPHDIDTVILTHGHADHIGGNIDAEGRPAFPNARYVMWKTEWDFWTSEPDLSSLKIPESLRELLLEYARKCLPPIRDQISLINEETEIVPGVRMLAAPGHTPGHMALLISSGGERLVHLVDAVVHPIHLESPEWLVATDLLPEETIATRHRLLDMAATEATLAFVFHFPFPALGHIVRTGSAWQWEAVTT